MREAIKDYSSQPVRNLLVNPSSENSSTALTVYQNSFTNPSAETVTSGTTTLRTNLLVNPNLLTTDASIGVYSAQGTLTKTRVSGSFASASYYSRATINSIASSPNTMWIIGGYSATGGTPVLPSTAYTASVYGRISWSGGSAYAYIEFYRSDGTWISASTGTKSTIAVNTIEQRYVTTVSPANAAYARVDFLVDSSTAAVGNTLDASCFMIEQTDQARPYFDGSMTAALGWTYGWSGTAGASTSTAKASSTALWANQMTNPAMKTVSSGTATFRTNLIANPAAISTGAGFGGGVDQGAATITNSTTGGPTNGPASYIRATVTTASSSNVTGFYISQPTQGVVPGQTYTASVYGRTSTAASSYAAIYWQTANGTIVGSPIQGTASTTIANVWERRSVTAIAPVGAVYARVDWRTPNPALGVGATLDVTGYLLEQTDQVRPYFDGSVTSALGWTYAWTGTINNSSSTAKTALAPVWTNQFTNPSMQSVTSGTSTFRTNLVLDPRATSGTYLYNWNGGDSTGRGTTSAPAVSGMTCPNAYRITFTTASTSLSLAAIGVLQQYNTVTPGLTYTGSLDVRVSVPQTVNCELKFHDSSGNSLGARTGTWVTMQPGVTYRLSNTQTAPANAAKVQLAAVSQAGGTVWPLNSYMEATAFLLEQTNQTRPYFDGSTATYQGWTYGWSGTTNASTSTAKASLSVIRTNLVTDPHAVGSGWGNQTPTYSTPTTLSYNATGAQDGGSAYQLQLGTGTVTNDTKLRIKFPASGTYTMTAGNSITASVDIYSPEAINGLIEIGYNGGGFVSATAQPLAANTWTRVSGSFTIPSGATGISQVQFISTTAPTAGSTYLASRALVELNTAIVGTYFDGTQSNSDNFIYAWAGTANSSGSYQWAPSPALDQGLFPTSTAFESYTRAYTGNSSVQVTCLSSVAAGQTLCYTNSSEISGLTVGQTYTYYVYVYVPTGAAAVRLEEVNGTFVGTASSVNDAWTRISLTFAASNSAAVLRIRAAATTIVGTSFWVGAKGFLAGNYTGSHFDGDTQASSDFLPTWSGTAHASAAYLMAPAISSYGAGGVTSKIWSGYDTAGNGVLKFRSDGAAANNGQNRIGINNGTITSGSTYTFVVTLYATVSSNWSYGVDGVGDSIGGSFTVGTTPITIYRTFTASAASGNGGFIRTVDTNAVGATLTVTNMMLVYGTYTGSYWDGDSPSTGDTTPAWNGTAHASASELRAPTIVSWNHGNGSGNANARVIPSYTRNVTGTQSAIYYSPGVATGDTGPQLAVSGMTIGQTYTIYATVYQPSLFTTSGVRAGIYTNSSWTGVSSWNTTVGSWTTLTSTFVASATTGVILVGAPNLNSSSTTPAPPAANTPIYIDNVMLVNGVYSGSYFDGANPINDTDLTTAWGATAHASSTYVTAPGIATLTVHSDTRGFQSSQWAMNGSKSIRLVAKQNIGGYSEYYLNTNQWYVGQTLTFIATRRTTNTLSGTGAARMSLRFWGATDSNLNNPYTSFPVTAGTQTARVIATVPAGTTSISARVSDSGAPGQPDVWWDNLMVVDGNYQGPYLDGTTPGAAWEGTAHNSTSKGYPQSPALVTNLLTYPNSNNTLNWGGNVVNSSTVSDTTAKNGFAYQIQATSTITAIYAYVGTVATAGTSTIRTQGGQTYTGVVRIRQTAGTLKSVQARLVPRDTSGSGLGDIVGTSITPTALNQWVTVRVTGTMPVNAVSMQLQGRCDNSIVSGDTFQIDSGGIYVGTYIGDVVDGNTPGWNWTGTANASTSYGYSYKERDPTYITGMTARWRADSITGVADGAKVSSWTDMTSNAYIANNAGGGGASTVPTYKLNVLNGQPSVRFNIAQKQFLYSANAPSGDPTQTVVAVLANYVVTGASQTIRGATSSGGLQTRITNGLVENISQFVKALGSASTSTPAQAAIISTYDASAGSTYTINGNTAGSSATTSTLTARGTVIGLNGSSSSEGLGCDLLELICWNRVLTSTEKAVIDRYIQDRYGITVTDYNS